MAEGLVTGDYTYTKNKVNHSDAIILAAIAAVDEPKSIAEAVDRDDGAEWWKSVCDEMLSWKALEVYSLVDEH
eukprot:1809866-Rhodomonas_salina.1